MDAVHLKEKFARVGTSRAGFALPTRKNRPLAEPAPLYCFLLAEVALEQAFKRLAVAGLVAGHFVHGVMDGVEVERLGERPS